MKKAYLFIIFALLFGCTTEKTSYPYCVNVTLSDGLPVQFFTEGCETFNEKEVGGVFQKCFAHPWQCDDEIKLQLPQEIDYTGTANDYSLIVKDEDGNEIDHLHYIRSTVVDQATLLFSVGSQYALGETNPALILTWNTGSTFVNGTSNPGRSKYFDIGVITNGLANYPINISGQFTLSSMGADTQTTIHYYLFNSDYTESVTAVGTPHISDGTYTDSVSLNPDFDPVHFAVRVYFAGTTTTSRCTLLGSTYQVTNGTLISSLYYSMFHFQTSNYSLSFVPGEIGICDQQINLYLVLDSTPDEDIAHADPLDIRETQDETILITYSNHRNYAGLNYSDVSPDPEFNLRIPAIFLQEDFPQTEEVMQLSDSRSIQLNSEILSKWILQVKQVPMWMHKKILIALTHQYVYIQGQYFVKNDPYEILKGNRRYPLKQATCLLTEKDDIQRNIL